MVRRQASLRKTYGKHGNTSMGQFGLTVSLEGSLVGLLGEAKRVEKTDRGKGTWDGIDGEGESSRLLVGRRRSKGGGRAEESDKGSSEFHLGVSGGVMVFCRKIMSLECFSEEARRS